MKKAFTMIELMIVVSIIGLLAAIAVPNYIKFQCRAKQSEVKNNLKALFTAEQTYRSEYDSYHLVPSISPNSTATNVVGFSPAGSKQRYTYEVPTADAVAFSGEGKAAAGVVSAGGDEWTISQLNDMTTILNACD